MYSSLYFKQTSSVPRGLVLSVVFMMAIAVGVYGFTRSSPRIQATAAIMTDFAIVNLQHESAGIYFRTPEPEAVYVTYKAVGGDRKTAYDYQDRSGTPRARTVHFFPLTGLKPLTQYELQMVSGKRLLTSNSNTPLSFKTPPRVSAPLANVAALYGKVVTSSGLPLAGAYVIITPQGSGSSRLPLLAVTKPSGEWLTTAPYVLSDDTQLHIRIVKDNEKDAVVRTVVSRASPLPDVIKMGADYEFPAFEDVLPATSNRDELPQYVISILYPERDAVIPAQKPLIKGFGVPGTDVFFVLDSQPQFSGKTVVSKRGTWQVFVPQPLLPGGYSISVNLQDNQGNRRNLSRSFFIAKSGEQVLGERTVSTPSGTLTPRVTFTITQFPQPTITLPAITTPTVQPTLIVPTIDDLTGFKSLTVENQPPGATLAPAVVASGVAVLFLGLVMAIVQ
jgi:hypothetical protein